MTGVDFGKIPQQLRDVSQWVLWRHVTRDGNETKVPFQISSAWAKNNDPDTWSAFGAVKQTYEEVAGRYDGVGFVFSADDPFCGVDLDGCRAADGTVSDWAREIILKLDCYAEVSPSKTGVKIICQGGWHCANHQIKLADVPVVCAKKPAVEVYDQLRYFAVTGWRLKGPTEPQDRQAALDWLKDKFWPTEPAVGPRVEFRSDDAVFERARKYLATMPGAVSGQFGHNATFKAACVLVLGFELPETQAMAAMQEYNQRCDPPWSERDLARKVKEAQKQGGERGYLRNKIPANWKDVRIPKYTAGQREPAKPEPEITTLTTAARDYIARVRSGAAVRVGTSLANLDHAIMGGYEAGNLVIMAARPSQGKSLLGLQSIHYWTELYGPCVIVSEEMSPQSLGKRLLQFESDLPEGHWDSLAEELDKAVERYARIHKECQIISQCGTADSVVEEIERAVTERGIQFAVLDYVQLLRAPGNSLYEQVTYTSKALRALVNRTGIILLALAQFSRKVEDRPVFIPKLSDLGESGQLERDADVVLGLCWPYKMNHSEPEDKYQIFPLKNRNGGILEQIVTCRIRGDRQMID